MIKSRAIGVAAILSAVVLAGCGYKVSPYGISTQNVSSLKSAAIKPVSVAAFTATKPGRTGIGCRAAGPVETPNKETYEIYVQKAFIDELQIAGLYDEASDIKIHGVLEEIDFSSNIGAGKWIFRLAVSSTASPGFVVQSQHEFSTNFIADKACQQVAQNFSVAVQKLIGDVVSNPEFRSLAP